MKNKNEDRLTKLAKSNRWHAHTSPSCWMGKPVEPLKRCLRVDRNPLGEFQLSERTTFSLSQLPIPEGVDFKDIKFYIEFELNDSDGYDAKLEFFTEDTVEFDNPRYDSEMKRYETEMLKWNAEQARHKKEVEQWKVWKKQKEETDLEAKLAASEAFLKKHGRLK